MTARSFHIGDILSVTTRILMSRDHMDGVFNILNFMTGEPLYLHALGRVREEALPYLLEQMPWLKDVVVNDDTFINWPEGLTAIEEQWGAYHDVLPMHREDHTTMHPVQEAIDLGLADKMTAFDLDGLSAADDDISDDTPPAYGTIDWRLS